MIGFVLPILAAVAAASPIQTEMLTKQALHSVPIGWEHKADAPGHLKLNMHIALKEQNMDKLQQRLMEVSTPGHDSYGKHMTKEEVDAMTAPAASDVAAVEEWLASHGVQAGKVANGMMPVTLTTSQAEKMLGTKYGIYYHAEKDQYTLRTTKYSLPKSVHSSIDMVQPTTLFSDMNMYSDRAQATMAFNNPVSDATNLGCTLGVTPSCLQSLYNIKYKPTSNTAIGITGYLGEIASKSDLSTFLKQYTKVPSSATFSVQLVNGGSNTGSGTTEANLDTQYVMGLSYPIKNIFYETAGEPPFNPDASDSDNTNEPYLEWLNYMNGLSTVPLTVSSSYGDNEQTVPNDYANTVCNNFMKLAARGVSILASSGDGGVGGGQPSECVSNDGSNRELFLPTFPASCPYGVTAVGGTQGQSPETAASLSSGGFSNYFAAPSYQSSQTQAYISSIGTQYAGLYNKTGRGIPDVAAQAENFLIVVGGSTQSVAGTSCAAPTFSAIVALLNDYLVSQKRSPLGFLNPFLYGKGVAGLNDITSGNNPGCNTNGFSAKKGWDPVTGLGTPNAAKLQTLV
ncbi:Hypothetical protein R9X50_00423600 [Acrodontium crateriforme]|uniref:tripeptidyl-peptidase II n=1 Tax=Acrodontium crateriforme TaxID=150365 RepID=A0AAQ3M7M6_9PEZI|nr:Hypothetical protein R9X50_00423600 [Acrodontium crateriforme]